MVQRFARGVSLRAASPECTILTKTLEDGYWDEVMSLYIYLTNCGYFYVNMFLKEGQRAKQRHVAFLCTKLRTSGRSVMDTFMRRYEAGSVRRICIVFIEEMRTASGMRYEEMTDETSIEILKLLVFTSFSRYNSEVLLQTSFRLPNITPRPSVQVL